MLAYMYRTSQLTSYFCKSSGVSEYLNSCNSKPISSTTSWQLRFRPFYALSLQVYICYALPRTQWIGSLIHFDKFHNTWIELNILPIKMQFYLNDLLLFYRIIYSIVSIYLPGLFSEDIFHNIWLTFPLPRLTTTHTSRYTTVHHYTLTTMQLHKPP